MGENDVRVFWAVFWPIYDIKNRTIDAIVIQRNLEEGAYRVPLKLGIGSKRNNCSWNDATGVS